LYHGHAEYLLLHSAAYGRYLAATDAPAPLGHRGLRVELRDYAQPEVQAIMWKADGVDTGNDVLLWQFTGRCLRANGRYLSSVSWNNGVSAEDIEDTYIVSTMMHWVVEPIPARESMPPLPRQTGVSPPCPLRDSSRICANWVDMRRNLTAKISNRVDFIRLRAILGSVLGASWLCFKFLWLLAPLHSPAS
jgi:hypothetical protein